MRKKILLGVLGLVLLALGYRSIALLNIIEIFEIDDPDDLTEPLDLFYNETIRDVVSVEMEEVELTSSIDIENFETYKWKEFSFSLPREDRAFIEEGEQSLHIYFENGAEMVFILFFEEDLLSTYENDFPAVEYLSPEFEEMGIETTYDFYLQAYKVQPEDVHWWDSNTTLLKGLSLLKIKELLMLRSGPYYFAHFESENVKGFQACKMEIPECENKVSMELFIGGNESYHYNLLTENLTQDELSALLLSIQTL